MSQDLEGFDAYVCHPQFGSSLVRGRFILYARELRFESPEAAFVLPLAVAKVQLDRKDHDWITLVDERQPDLSFQVESAILNDPCFTKNNNIRLQLQRQLGGREMRRRLLATGGFFVGFILIVWLVSHAAGWVVPLIAKRIPASTEVAYGDKLFAENKEELDLVDDTNAVAAITALAQPLVQSLPTHGIPIRFYLVKGPPNAFAMPGGRIMITTGLLHLLETPDQLLGVIAHESAHILQHHTDQQVLSDQGPLFVLRILASGDSSVLRAIAAPSALLIHDSFSQRYEKEADAYGWNYLVAAGLNPHGEIEALEKLASTDPGDAHLRGLSSHPDMDKRIGWLTEKWDHLPQHDHFIELTNPMPKAED